MNLDYQRIEKAIHYIDNHFQLQPELKDVADELGLSAYHFQKLFMRWAGISPKRFLQYITVDYAKQLLKRSNSVFDVSLETGLSSAARLYDHFVILEAMTPGEYKSQAKDLIIKFGIHETVFGKVLIAITCRGVCHLSFLEFELPIQKASTLLTSEWPQASVKYEPSATLKVISRLFNFSANQSKPLSVLVKGSNFQIQVWKALLRIPPATLVSYHDIATAMEMPKASRAIGNAVGANSVAFLIPCHRVVKSTGQHGQYRWGATRKKALIAWEAANA